MTWCTDMIVIIKRQGRKVCIRPSFRQTDRSVFCAEFPNGFWPLRVDFSILWGYRGCPRRVELLWCIGIENISSCEKLLPIWRTFEFICCGILIGRKPKLICGCKLCIAWEYWFSLDYRQPASPLPTCIMGRCSRRWIPNKDYFSMLFQINKMLNKRLLNE